MIIVWGSIETSSDHRDEVVKLSLAHVHCSRQEPGCLCHSVQVDVENRNRLVFYEEWESMAALQAHFEVPESGGFVEAVTKKTIAPPDMKMFDATPIK
jgi:quinol monooxygenase YgiN